MKKLLTAFLVCSFITINATTATKINRPDFFAPARLGDIQLIHDDNNFYVIKNNKVYDVPLYNVDKVLRNISSAQLDAFLGKDKDVEFFQIQEDEIDFNEMRFATNEEIEVICSNLSSGYINISQTDDGEYILRAKTRVLGGGGFGAFLGAVGGKFLVHAVAGAGCAVVGLAVTCVAGPVAGAAAASGTWGVVAPTVEVASTTVALATGIAAGVVTGPV